MLTAPLKKKPGRRVSFVLSTLKMEVKKGKAVSVTGREGP
jgi:hypothetical protein